MKLKLAILLLGCCYAFGGGFYEFTNYNPDLPESAPSLAEFKRPSGDARVQTWWHWINSNVSREGASKDLKAMADANFGAAIIFNISGGPASEGGVKFNTPQWFDFFKFVVGEAKKNGMEIGIHNCDGWSEAGGPWVSPEMSMKVLTSSKVRVSGGGERSVKLPKPKSRGGFYRDIAAFAYPAFRAKESATKKHLVAARAANSDTAPVGKNIADISDGDFSTFLRVYSANETYKFFGLDMEFDKPVEASSAYINFKWDWQTPEGVFLAASDDGKNFSDVCAPQMRSNEGLFKFPSRRAKFWRLGKRVGPRGVTPFQKRMFIAEFELIPSGEISASAPMITAMPLKVAASKNNFHVPYDDAPVPARAIIDPKKIVFLEMGEGGAVKCNLPKSDWEVVRVGYTTSGVGVHPASPSGRGLETDKLDSAATDLHFDSYISKMIDAAGADAGKVFKYIETDSWECGAQNWTPSLPEEFKKLNGYGLLPWLPAMLGEVVQSKKATENFAADLRLTLSQMVNKNFYGRLGERVRARGLEYQTEPLSESSLRDQIGLYKGADIPQNEVWQDLRKVGDPAAPSDRPHVTARDAADFFGKKLCTCESLTQDQGNWADSPLALKGKIDTIFLAGMNTIVFHSYVHQPDERVPGWAMEPWGSCINRKMPWFALSRAFFDCIGRSQYMLQQGKPVVNGLALMSQEVPVVGNPNPAGRGFFADRINVDCLENYLRVEDGKLVSPGRIKYDYLELPNPTYPYRASVLRAIEKLVSQGATVCAWKPSAHRTNLKGDELRWRELNDRLFGDGSRQIRNIGKGRVYVQYHPKELVGLLGLKPSFKIADPQIAVRAREHIGGARWYYVVNCAKADKFFEASFAVDDKFPEIWNPETGKAKRVDIASVGGGYTTIPMRLGRNESVFVVFRQKRNLPSVESLEIGGEKFFPSPARDFGELAPKVSVLPNGKLAAEFFSKGEIKAKLSGGEEVSLAAKKIRDPIEFEKPFSVSFDEKFGAPKSAMFGDFISWTKHPDPRVKHYSGVGVYRLKINLPKPGKGERAYVQFGEILEVGRVKVNGHCAATLWKKPYRADITKFIKPGENIVEVEVGNTWVNRCLYDATLPPDKRITWSNSMNYHFPPAGSKLLLNQGMNRSWKQGPIPSGIIGNARVVWSRGA